MTEWIVDHIDESFKQKKFPIYKEIFDLFTRIFGQCRQVAIPMEILTMALYERITDTLSLPQKDTKKPSIPEAPSVVPASIKLTETPKQTSELPSPTHELAPASLVLREPTHELTIPQHEIAKGNTIPDGSFSSEALLAKAKELGLKNTLLPLLRTATIELREKTIHINTTQYASERCNEGNNQEILLATARLFEAESVEIHIRETTESEPDIVDIATAIFS